MGLRESSKCHNNMTNLLWDCVKVVNIILYRSSQNHTIAMATPWGFTVHSGIQKKTFLNPAMCALSEGGYRNEYRYVQ